MLPTLTFAAPLVLLLLPIVLGWAAWLWLRDRGNLSPLRHRLALALRLLILGALIFVLAGATWQQAATRQATVFVADLSASTAGVQDREAAFIASALKARGHEDVAAVVAVGGDALVEQPIAALTNFPGFQSVVERNATDLESGLNLAGALFPAGYRKRVVLLTDGQQNAGDALGAARLLHDEGARLDVVALAATTAAEALVSSVQAPPVVSKDAHIPLVVNVNSTVAQTATLDVSDDGRPLLRLPVTLPVGDKQITLSLPALGSGFHRLHVILQPSSDTVAENNEGDAFTRVRGAAHVLVAEGQPGEGDVVAAALRAKGMLVQQEADTLVEPSTTYLSKFEAVVLVDVPATDLESPLLDPAHSPLLSYVDGGGGLVVIGGPNSYGVGGYINTALDSVLPVSMKLPQRKDTPSVAVALIIEDLESQTNVNISKVAGEGVVKLLTPLDRVAVNDASEGPDLGWAVPMQYVTNKDAIDRAIDAMNPVDPGSYRSALLNAYNALRATKAKIKHIILLGDGDAEDPSYFALVSQIRKAGITISTVATGGGPGSFGPSDYATMQNIARWGGGRYYQADNVHSIPQIFLKETKQIARTGIVEEHFNPEIVTDSPIIAGIPGTPLDGYVATTPKPSGTQVLTHVTKHGLDPILAQWQYGLGRAVAWTSDAQGRWSASLVASKQANRLWANMVSWVLPPESNANLAFNSTVSGNQAHLMVTTSGLPLDAQVTARVDGPAHGSTVTLPPTAPGQYEADMPLAQTGAYLVAISALVKGHPRAILRTGLVAPYAAEYLTTGLDGPLLTSVRTIGNGAELSNPAASFADNLPAVYAPQPLTVPLLLLVLLLLPFDVAVRRLLVGPAEARELLAALARRRALQPATAGTATASLSTVRTTRAVRRERLAGLSVAEPMQAPAPPAQPAVTPSPSSTTPAPAARPATPATRPAPPARPAPAPTASSSSPTAPAADSTTSKLLEAKRRRRGS